MRLSKSKLVAYRQCPKRLWLQTYRRELARQSEAVENRMAQGTLVGAAAQRQYPEGRLIAHVLDLPAALRDTDIALAQNGDLTLFEAALRWQDVLVRADVLIRHDGRYRIIEVKASTKVKDSHLTDASIQTWVARGAGLDVEKVELAHIDNRFVYPGGDDYRGLFEHVDMTAAVEPLQAEIPGWVEGAQRDLAEPMPDIAVGKQCHDPFECEFLAFCAPEDVAFPVELLPNGTRLVRALRQEGFPDLRDVPIDRLPREDHRRIWRATTSGQAEIDPAAAARINALPSPRYFLDFETVGPAVPRWAGTRPYQKIPMQWSCHRQDADGTVTELPPYLDTTGADPRRAFATTLVDAISHDGIIVVYNATFERGVMMQMAETFDDLAPALRDMASRLFDLLPFTREHYYHPAMLGSWSIKRVLPTIAPDLDYGNLELVQSGDMVEPIYFEMVEPATTPERRDALAFALRTYCARDTLAMVRLVTFFGG